MNNGAASSGCERYRTSGCQRVQRPMRSGLAHAQHLGDISLRALKTVALGRVAKSVDCLFTGAMGWRDSNRRRLFNLDARIWSVLDFIERRVWQSDRSAIAARGA